jgi:hypothetical protein
MPRKELIPIYDKQFYLDNYVNKQKSPYTIADESNGAITHNRVRAELRYYSIPIRDKSSAQKAAFATGKNVSPTKGKKRTEEEKRKIGSAISATYSDQPEEVKKERSRKAKENFRKMDPEAKERFKQGSVKAVKEASKRGSKLENYLGSMLSVNYLVETQKTDLIENEKLRIDLYLPELLTAIEINGPSHYRDIWNDPIKFAEKRRRDDEKAGLLLKNGYNLIILETEAEFTEVRGESALTKVLWAIANIKDNNLQSQIIKLGEE